MTQNEQEEDTACLTHPMTTQGQQAEQAGTRMYREVGGSELWKGHLLTFLWGRAGQRPIRSCSIRHPHLSLRRAHSQC